MLKNTRLSAAVIDILTQYAKPLSVPELLKALNKRGLQPNKTSLYRLLEKLKKADIVEPVLLDSQTSYYELKQHHHHHFRCENCERIECLADEPLEDKIHALEAALARRGLKINTHQFSLSGRCAQCH